MAQKYGKVLTLKTADGDLKITDATQATAILKRLDNDARLFAITKADGSREYLNLSITSCVYCVVASYTTSATEVDDTPCEDALPATCPTTVAEETLPETKD